MNELSPIPDRSLLRAKLARLAEAGVYLGTSSWKYLGWMGQLYDEARYVYRSRFSETRFNRLCLSEYAEVFKTVGVDAAYYQFPSESQVRGWMESVPQDFLFSFKVTDDITLRRFPNLPRFGERAGRENPDFLNADKFNSLFLGPLQPYVERVGVLMFEFTRFHVTDFARGRDFLERLEAFLVQLPKGWRYGVELRNSNFLRPEYLAVLRAHGVAHVLTSWDAMPPFEEQSAMPGVMTSDSFTAGRLLLKPGRAYADAVSQFSPYRGVKEPYAAVRKAAAELVRNSVQKPGAKKVFLYVNNRLEGSALGTIQAILTEAGC